MYNLTKESDIKKLAKEFGFTFNKGYGQNFLTNENALWDITEHGEIDKNTFSIEIGPGFGTLTQKLCEKSGKVVAVELDKRLLPVLSETLKPYDNYKIINEDFLKLDLNKLISEEKGDLKAVVAANLPYYITTPIITSLIFGRYPIEIIVLMVQKEVANRIAARPKTKDYGALTVAVQYFCNAKVAFYIPASDFVPAPKVDSAVVVLDVLKEPSVKPKSEDNFFKVVKASFAQRRKTLKNGLANSGLFGIDKEEIGKIIKDVCGNENARGEEFSLEDFARLSDLLF